jgi:hypothetical protein
LSFVSIHHRDTEAQRAQRTTKKTNKFLVVF